MKVTIESEGVKKVIEINPNSNFTARIRQGVEEVTAQQVLKSGYEKVSDGSLFYAIGQDGHINAVKQDDIFGGGGSEEYYIANYYADYEVAEENARADMLVRQLRRLSANERRGASEWDNSSAAKWYIFYEYKSKKVGVKYLRGHRVLGTVYFDNPKTAQKAVNMFKDELIWYFTEYKDCLTDLDGGAESGEKP